MSNLTDIKLRLKAVSDTRQITSAMETISVAKMRKASARFESNRIYFEKIRETLSDIVYHSKFVSNRFIDKHTGNRAIFVVVASDKGLAGGFNHNVLNFAFKEMQKSEIVSVMVVGQVANEYFTRKGINVDVEFSGASYDPSMRDASEISQTIINLYDQDMMDTVYLVYTKMESTALMYPDIIKLLPIESSQIKIDKPLTYNEETYLQEIEYEPSPESVFAALIPQYLSGVIYGALVQSVASEHSTRRSAMSNATNNANEIIDELKIEFNRARQESVTNELSEIITAAMGVNNENTK